MKHIFKHLIFSGIILLSLSTTNAQNNQSARTITAAEWTNGAMPDTTGSGTPTTAILQQLMIDNNSLKPLGIAAGGPPLLVSNNPEKFTGDGWLVQHNRVDATQGGVDYPLSGTNRIYLFHLNNSGATKWIHLIMHNPGGASITYTAKGSYYTNNEKPLTGSATGQSYNVSKDWLNNTLRLPLTTSTTLAANGKDEIFKVQMNAANMVDGLFEITTSGPVYFYTIITSSGNTTTAKNATSGTFASYTAGDYRMETGGTYARQAGLYSASQISSNNVLNIPDMPSRIGFCLNTAAKFYPMLEEQTSPIIVKTPPTTDSVRLIGASSRSYGNYGNRYNLTFNLANGSTTTKTVKVYFAANSNLADATLSNATWNSQFKVNGTFINTYTQRNNPRKLLATLSVPTGTQVMTLEVYIPGLITTNHQLIFETTTVASPTLPVTFSSFTGTNYGNANSLKWITEQEEQLAQYELQKSNDGVTWSSIKNIKPQNSITGAVYTYSDVTDVNRGATMYYRLKAVNKNGSYSYSKLVALTGKITQSLLVSQNPFADQIKIKYEAPAGQLININLYNSQGQLIRKQKMKGTGQPSVYSITDTDEMPQGIYLLEVSSGTKRITEKLLKLN